MENYREQPPVDRIPDECMHVRKTSDRPWDAYYISSGAVHDTVRGIEDGKTIAETAMESLEYQLALSRHLHDALSVPYKLDPDGSNKLLAHTRDALVARGIPPEDIDSWMQPGNKIHPQEAVLEHYLGGLEAWNRSFAGLEPSYAEPLPQPAAILEERVNVLDVAVELLAPNESTAHQLKERYSSAVSEISSHLLEHNRPGLGISFGSFNQGSEWNMAFVPKVVEALQTVRETEGDDSYRQLYNFATSQLRGEAREAFLEQLPKEPTRPFPESTEVVRDEVNNRLWERFTGQEEVVSVLSNGEELRLPFTEYRTRTVLGWGATSEHEVYEADGSINFENLTEDQKGAVEMAIVVQDNDLLRIETMPNFKRIALHPGDEGKRRAYTVMHRDGYNRLMNRYPDHHGMVTSETERQLEAPVKDAAFVTDGWLVTPYSGDYLSQETFRDAEINFFGPEDGSANAFWIAGDTRCITAKDAQEHQRLYADDDSLYGSSPRFTMTPVRFFQIAVDVELALQEREAEDRAFINQRHQESE